MRISLITLGIVLAGTLLFTSCSDDDDNSTSPNIGGGEDLKTATEILTSDNDLSTLAGILTNDDFGLSAVVAAASNKEATLTIFAPTNKAFTDLLEVLGLELNQLTPSVVNNIVQYHVLTQMAKSTDLATQGYATLLGASEEINVDLTNGVKINDASVAQADIEASNAVIHKIDKVLIPSEPTAILGSVLQPAYFNKDFTTLVAAVRKAELISTLLDPNGSFTVFAPTNDAFAAAGVTSLDGLDKEALTPILQYHVLGSKIMQAGLPTTNGSSEAIPTLNGKFFLSNAGSGVFINANSQVVATDLVASNGVVHVIDKMLSPASGNIVSVASANSDFDLLVAALTRTTQEGDANLVDVLNGEGPFTVFAPNDAAFLAFTGAADEAAAKAVINDLPIATLVKVLQYHVVPTGVASKDVKAGSVTTASMDAFEIVIGDSGIKISDINTSNTDATIAATDVLATNGIIHVIDQVISPVN